MAVTPCPRRVCRAIASFLLVALFAACLPAAAIQPDESSVHFLSRPFVAPELQVEPALAGTTRLDAASRPALPAAAQDFLARHGGEWESRDDLRAARPNLVQGSGIPLWPGRGNDLSAGDLGLAAGTGMDLDAVEAILIGFIRDNEDFLGTTGLEFALDPDNSTAYGEGDTHWFVAFQQLADGVPVHEARLFFRVSHGNLVQFGSERVAPVAIPTLPSSSAANAFDLAWRELGFPATARLVEVRDPGTLRIYPAAPPGERPGEAFAGRAGLGYDHVLAWHYVFRLDGDSATYEVIQDARSNRVLAVNNLTLNVDATVTAGVYPATNSDPEIVVPMPFLAVSNGGAKVTDALGMYDYSGGTASTSLDGKYFRMSDGCGSINLSAPSGGNLVLGTSGGTDCTTPGFGGAGNTHASRTGFYHLTRINRKAATFFPSNGWLASKVTASMNENQTCNASWDGSMMHFYRSGGGCSNTGEIAAVFLHEWGHGMDSNTGGAANEYGSGEAVGDTFAFLEMKDACIGPNFKPGVPCYNCDASCTGVRDVEAFSTRGAAVTARPSTITDPGGPACARFACPYLQQGIWPYQGPMGYEGHCESYIAGSANWDLSQSLVEEFGDEGWAEMDRIWYGSLVPSKSAYRVASGGTCNVNAQVDGCGSSNWYTVFLAADDDDGNLANGTPNACRIWDAFDAHGIACGARPACTAWGGPDFGLGLPVTSASLCVPGTTSYTIDVESRNGFDAPVTLAVTGLPPGASASFSQNPVPPGQSATLHVQVGAATPAGEYTLSITGSAAGSPGHGASVSLAVWAGVPAVPALAAPADGAGNQPLSPVLSWAAVAGAAEYEVEIATDADFANVVYSASITATQASTVLQPQTQYWWRVRAKSPCGAGAWSPARSFTTGLPPFPEPYCIVSFPSGIEPISRVVFAGIDNASPTSGGPALQDFTAVIGNVAPGDAATMRVEGNTAGNFSTPVRAYIDWNRNGSLADAGEVYTIGTLQNSTGADGKFVSAPIAVPAGVTPGPVRMRVVKRYSAAGDPCNSSGYGQAEDYTLIVAAPAGSYSIGGTASGVAGAGLSLTLNGTESLAVPADGPFTFATLLPTGATYAVSIATVPAGHTCAIANGSGTVGSGNVTNVVVTCVPPPPMYTIGGSASGLTGDGLVLRLNGSENLPVAADGPFVFATPLASGAAYAVTLAAAPAGQTCSIANGSGTVGGANVTHVAVTCVSPPPTYSIGGSASGLRDTGLVLALNGDEALPVPADGPFVFATPLPAGATYAVTIASEPEGQTCEVANGQGTVGSANITDVVVTCTTPVATHTIGGEASGLGGPGLVLQLNGGNDLAVPANGPFVFGLGLPEGATWQVTLLQTPPGQECRIENASGTVTDADIRDVRVHCGPDDRLFSDGFEGEAP
ncbi:MAG: hypothetical protein J0H15_03080 [Xanthomonadales bacterium]|nr:hypothetical protein [Xanthomonadales bacterium]